MLKNINVPDQVIQNNIAHFRLSESKIEQNGKPFTPCWNWSSFLFGLYWLIYRRCYKWTAIIFCGYMVASAVLGAISGGLLSIILALAFWVCNGLFGDSMYFYAIKEKIYDLKQKGLTDEQVIDKTKPSWIPIIIVSAIFIVLGIIFAFIIGSLFVALFASMGSTIPQ